jgi:NAD(P)-dependent dehydrogenase (short-subunit alcohol dehydrogenase family)
MPTLTGKAIIITGAAQGIGAVLAAALATEGALVAVSDVRDCSEVVDRITLAGGQAIGIGADVSDDAACSALAKKTFDAYGSVDGLVTNAAIFSSLERKSFDRITVPEWDQVMAVNVRGVFNCVQAVVPYMKERGYGKIVNVCSTTVFAGAAGLLHYVTSKGAVLAFTRALAREVGEFGIRVNAFAPGLTMSEGVRANEARVAPQAKAAPQLRALKREQIPEDLVGTLLFLVSPESDFMTGQTLVVDGGHIMR